jgi:hypothetical protein
MRRVLERCAALDVHKKQLTACARILGQGGELEELTAEFPPWPPICWRCATG